MNKVVPWFFTVATLLVLTVVIANMPTKVVRQRETQSKFSSSDSQYSQFPQYQAHLRMVYGQKDGAVTPVPQSSLDFAASTSKHVWSVFKNPNQTTIEIKRYMEDPKQSGSEVPLYLPIGFSAVVGGKEGSVYPEIYEHTIESQGQSYGYVASGGNLKYEPPDLGTPGGLPTRCTPVCSEFSAAVMIVNGKQDPVYGNQLSKLFFSPNGKHYAYMAQQHRSQHAEIILDGSMIGELTLLSDVNDLTFAVSDSGHVVFASNTEVSLDGKKVGDYKVTCFYHSTCVMLSPNQEARGARQ